ncbi:histidinol dehydrogenase [Roseivirga sp. BDSF3-8]|uniref:histidinol dehydrogenase n=1 Tax=Roseivirga sp. BDSF3-8 TaxID=3241598 RepID=UPI0035327C44
MKIVENPPRDTWESLLARPVQDHKTIKKIVKPIIRKVERKGDKALYKLAEEYDHVKLSSLLVTEEELNAAAERIDDNLRKAIDLAVKNITAFHQKQADDELVVETMPGVICRRKSVPIEKVGLYVPGGTAPLFSTVLMLGIPARIAGCREIVLATPPDRSGNVHPAILYAANQVGVTRIVKAGGAQAVAAMTFGTESVPRVHKIFGPGNQYVTAAKQFVTRYGIAIDMPAGPSEVAVIADAQCPPAFVAADLLSQAEHGVDSQVILVSTDKAVLEGVSKEVDRQLQELPRKEIASKALENSLAILVEDDQQAIDLINDYGPEHLILAMENAVEAGEKIINAGSVFLGNYTPESAGDYASGTNHTLPTNGYAKAYSGVSVDSFVRKITFQEISPAGLKNIGPAIETMAHAEELHAHKQAVSIRLNYLANNGNQ